MTTATLLRPVPRALLPDRFDLVWHEALQRIAAAHPEAVAPRRYEYARPGYGLPEVVVPSLHVEAATGSGIVYPLVSASDVGRCRGCDPDVEHTMPRDVCDECGGTGVGPRWLRADLGWWFIDGGGTGYGSCNSGGLWWRLLRMEATDA